MSKPELIIFDLGRVLVDFDFKKAIRRLKPHSPKTEAEIRHFFSVTPLWDAFERGTLNPREFFKALQTDLALKDLTWDMFVPMWNDIFQAMPDSVEIVARLKGRYRLAIISNVNQLHWEYVVEKNPFIQWFEIPIASYAVGHRKPEAEIYRLALRQADVAAERAVFIDDVEAHIHAATALGIRSHHFSSARQLQADLRDIL